MRTHEPWHRAIDMKHETLKWHNSDFGQRWTYYFFHSVFSKAILNGQMKGDAEELTEQDRDAAEFILERLVRESLYRGDVMFVTEEMQEILMQAADDLPNDIVLHDHDLLTNIGYCQFERPMFGCDAHGKEISISALSWVLHPAGDQMVINLFYFSDAEVNDDLNPIFRENCREHGVPYPSMGLSHWYPLTFETLMPTDDRVGSEVVIGLLKMFIAMQLVAQQKIGTTVITQPHRAVRRRWHLDESSYISVITLRRKKAILPPDHEPAKMEYSHRWLVSSHWRRQWYPSTKSHGWKYIYEFIKGPEDKPLVIREGRVFNFRR
jgi:hypothetical protein